LFLLLFICSSRTFVRYNTWSMVLYIWTNVSNTNCQFLIPCYHQNSLGFIVKHILFQHHHLYDDAAKNNKIDMLGRIAKFTMELYNLWFLFSRIGNSRYYVEDWSSYVNLLTCPSFRFFIALTFQNYKRCFFIKF